MSLGLYVHIPFCGCRCPYCGFAVVTGEDDLGERYAQTVCGELETLHRHAPPEGLSSVFFGGGTPSRLAPVLLERILASTRSSLGIASGAEITLEANPGTTDIEGYAAFAELGINRLSLGVQSFADSSLRLLGRSHSAAEALSAYAAARDGGFVNVSIDLIFSVPGADREDWLHSLEVTVDLSPEHVSTYALTVEEGTLFHRRALAGDLPLVCEDEDAYQYTHGIDVLSAAGYGQYEISNFARDGRRSRHNWSYWSGVEYLGVGMSSHSYMAGIRSWNTANLRDYIDRVEAGDSPRLGEEIIDAATERRERIWLGLRTCEGAALTSRERAWLAASDRVTRLVRSGYVEHRGDRVHLTAQGIPVADAVASEIVAVLEETCDQAAA